MKLKNQPDTVPANLSAEINSLAKIILLTIAFPVLICSSCSPTKNEEPKSYASLAKTLLESKDAFRLKEGDLLFQDVDCGPFCDAVEKVTFGIGNAKFSHIGLVVSNTAGELVVLEAVSKGVILTPVDTFLNRSFDVKNNPKVVVGRLKSGYAHLVEAAVEAAYLRLGKPYDEIFDIENDKYYCSELVYLAFKEANNGKAVFQLQPMTFKDPDTNQPFSIWVDYYEKLGEPIPEGQPGLNPGGISRSDFLEMVHYFGRPDVK